MIKLMFWLWIFEYKWLHVYQLWVMIGTARFSATLPPLLHTAACVFFLLWMTSSALTFILKGSFTALTVISRGNPTRAVCSIQWGHRKKTFDVSFHLWHQVDIKCGLWLYRLGRERMWKNVSAFVKACRYLFQFPLIVTPHGWNYSFLSHSRKFPFSATCKATHLPSFPDSLWPVGAHTDMNTIAHRPPWHGFHRHSHCTPCSIRVRVRARECVLHLIPWDRPASRRSLCFQLLPSDQSLNHIQVIC